MYFNLTEQIKGMDGKVLKFESPGEDAEGKPVAERKDLDLKTVLIKALTEEPTAKDGEEKFKRFKLATKIDSAVDLVELSNEEVTKIKELIGKVFTTVVVGRAYDLLENPVPSPRVEKQVDRLPDQAAA